MWGLLRLPQFRGAAHASGLDNRLDIAKSVFQVHGVDAAGQVLIRRQLKRRAVLAFFQKLPVCLVGIEACASSHYWSNSPSPTSVATWFEMRSVPGLLGAQISCNRAASYARPEGSITGVASIVEGLASELVELGHEVIPGSASVSWSIRSARTGIWLWSTVQGRRIILDAPRYTPRWDKPCRNPSTPNRLGSPRSPVPGNPISES